MARPGREEDSSTSSRRTPIPSKRNDTAISKTSGAIENEVIVASNTNANPGNAEKPTPNPTTTSAIDLEDSDGDENEGRNNTVETKAASSSDLSATPADELYTPLLMFICEHGFMREKRYPVPRSVRVRFVRDVRAEARVLGFERAIVDRVLLDIKRYYLTKVGQCHVFDDGAAFGEEVDDSSSSEGLDVKTGHPNPQEKRKRKRNSGEEPAKKTSQAPVKATQGKAKRSSMSKKDEKETKLQVRPKKKKRSSKASSNTRALKGGAAFEDPIVLDF